MLRKSLLHSSSFPSSCAPLGPNLPDIWDRRKNTSSDTHISERHNCETEGAKSDAVILGGKSLAQDVKQKVAKEIGRIKRTIGKSPKLAMVLVGDRRYSQTFIHIKLKVCEQVGIEISVVSLPENCEEKELLGAVANFNKDPAVHGIIVQLPLPQNLDQEGFRVIRDVCFEEAIKVASALTPVPRVFGPVTMSVLLFNTLDAAKRALGWFESIPRCELYVVSGPVQGYSKPCKQTKSM